MPQSLHYLDFVLASHYVLKPFKIEEMTHMNKYVSRLLMASLLFVGLQTTALAESPDHLRFMAGPPGGNWFALGTSLADIWSKGVVQTTASTGGGVSNVINVNNKRGDLGFTVTSFIGAAMKDEAPFKGRNIDNAVVFANLYTQVTYFVANADFVKEHDIKSLDDLISKKIPVRFATLKPGSASEFTVQALLDKGYNTNFATLKKENDWSIQYASYEGGADLIADNHLDVFAFSVGQVAAIVMNIESRVPMVLLPVGQKALDALAAAYGTTTHIIEPGIYKTVTKPVKTIGDYTCIIVRKDLSDELVYNLSKVMWEKKRLLTAAVKDVDELGPSMAVPKGLPMHPGAVKFWNSLK